MFSYSEISPRAASAVRPGWRAGSPPRACAFADYCSGYISSMKLKEQLGVGVLDGADRMQTPGSLLSFVGPWDLKPSFFSNISRSAILSTRPYAWTCGLCVDFNNFPISLTADPIACGDVVRGIVTPVFHHGQARIHRGKKQSMEGFLELYFIIMLNTWHTLTRNT